MSNNPFLKRIESNSKQSVAYHRSSAQESEAAKKYGGMKIGPSKKATGDVRKKHVLRMECKTTSKKSFSITKAMIETIENAAIGNDEIPCVVVEFLDEAGKPDMEVAVVPTWAINWLIGIMERDGS